MVVTDTSEERSHLDELLLGVMLRVLGREEIVNANMLEKVMPPDYMVTPLMPLDDEAHAAARFTAQVLAAGLHAIE